MDFSDLTLGRDVTYSYSAYVCIEWVYPLHILAAYFTVVFGIACLVTRFRMKSWHAVSGRGFMIAMYFGYGTAILIHNTGTPLAIIVFMTSKLIAMSVGWSAIKRHKTLREAELTKRMSALWKGKQIMSSDLSYEQVVKQQKEEMNSERTTFASRFLTWKALHGVLMTYAWYNMFGRTMVTNPAEYEGCRTYPAWKTEDGPVEYIPKYDPDYFTPAEERAFILGTALGGFFFFVAVGALYSYYAAWSARRGGGGGDAPNKQLVMTYHSTLSRERSSLSSSLVSGDDDSSENSSSRGVPSPSSGDDVTASQHQSCTVEVNEDSTRLAAINA